jgi:hypothetical protein
MRAGIAIEKWKYRVFARHLEQAGFQFIRGVGVTPNTWVLYVECTSADDLKPVVKAAYLECRKEPRE